MPQSPNIEDDEIDLSELLAALWSHKFLIVLLTGFCIVLSGYYALTSEKRFTTKAIFQIQEGNSQTGFNISAELGALASLAGITESSKDMSSSKILLERATGREFILVMKDKLSLDLDPYINTYNPKGDEPFWKSTIKQVVGWQKTAQEKHAIIDNNVIENYRQNVEFKTTEGGAISVSVTHIDPQKASYYANSLMEEIRILVESESVAAQELRLNYLSETLADALQDMEAAQESLKNYNLENSALAQENFISDSLKLDQIRMEKRKVSEIADLLLIIEKLVKSRDLDDESYNSLRSSKPLVDDVDFRRILGMSETISAWTWPEIETIEAVSATLRDRSKRLDISIKNIEENAKIYATSAEDLVKLKRIAKISEATYTVLIEQVKSQTLAAGFQPKTFKVFEYATPPLAPSFPKRNLMLILGAVIGILIGGILALMNAARRGVYYTKSKLLSDSNAQLSLRSKSIKKLSQKSISDIISFISNRKVIALDEATLKIANKKIIYVLSCRGRPKASELARLLAIYSAQSGRSVLLCDTTGQAEKELKNDPTTQSYDFPIVSIDNKFNVIKGVGDTSFFTTASFKPTIKYLTSHFDQVFVCSTYGNTRIGLMALAEFVPGLVVIAGLRKTRKFDIKNIKSKQPLDLLFYD